ncbi:RrF2 family transcriptional regulator [Planctomycetes bacterium K23_9]|uniref:HTH-type transcriptional regulator CymR n=1 Tax=Stieleria marina TaxID=1930275 RepID=A0A517NY21_9BACT|nr:HTH-type transcriptional regulator CymR [Planctomycetes bacterium K23_9]
MFSQTSEYALRAVVWLAEHRNEGPVGNKRIASDTQVPASYLSKILHDLASAGFLSSRRGVGGGFQLIISPDELTMLDVVNAVDPLKRITFCAHVSKSSEPMCPMHQRLNQAIGLVQQTLGDATIAEVMQSPESVDGESGSQPVRVDRAPTQTAHAENPQSGSVVHIPTPTMVDDSAVHRQETTPLPSVLAASGAR